MKKDLGYVKGPKGDTGPQGAVGPQGAKGEKGDPARVCGKLAGADGNIQLVAADVGGLSAEQINALLLNKANSIGAISQAQFDSLNYSHTIFGCIGPWVTGHPRGNDYGIIELGAYGLDTHLPNGMQEITYTNGDRYYRKAVNGSISRWFKIATATPPEWHNAPLETGWSWTSQGRYGKDGSGKGYLIGVVNKASVPTSGEAILRLPTGFRPPVLWPVSFSSAKGTDGSSWATYGYLWPDGYLRFHGGALPANYSLNQGIAFAAEFPAV